MKRVLVTGANGFVGRQTLKPLIGSGYEVHAADIREISDLPRGVIAHRVDLLDAASLRELMAEVSPSHLLHLAWYVAPGQFWTSLENVRWVQASLDLLLAFAGRGGKRCVTAGTCAEYIWSGDGVCREEDTPLAPSTLYGASKGALCTLQAQIARQTGISAAWGRIFHLYGPHEPASRLVPAVVRALLRAEPALCSHGRQIRDWLHVEDVARAFVTILDCGYQGPVNIGSGDPASLRQVAEIIARQIGSPELLRMGAIEAKAGDPDNLVADVSRLRSLGFTPRYSLQEGLAHTIAWWRSSATL